jgi:hypothetical protein
LFIFATNFIFPEKSLQDISKSTAGFAGADHGRVGPGSNFLFSEFRGT